MKKIKLSNTHPCLKTYHLVSACRLLHFQNMCLGIIFLNGFDQGFDIIEIIDDSTNTCIDQVVCDDTTQGFALKSGNSFDNAGIEMIRSLIVIK